MSILVVAPHPDDETLGCGGTLLRHGGQGEELHWLIITGMSEAAGYTPGQMERRAAEIDRAAAAYGFGSVHQLGFPPGGLDAVPLGEVIGRISAVVAAIKPTTVYLPFPGDAHTDHLAAYKAAVSCVKSFRYPSVRRVLAYETLSETDFGLQPHERPFQPNVFVDITPFLEEKLRIMNIFASELAEFPFPRSETAIRAQASLRGVAAGVRAAESFMLLKEIQC